MDAVDRQVFKCVCPLDCPDTCAMVVTVEDGVAIDLRGDKEHPFTRGFLCRGCFARCGGWGRRAKGVLSRSRGTPRST
jgi:hypothetical protein